MFWLKWQKLAIKGVFEKDLNGFLLIQQKRTFNDDLVVITREIKRRDEIALITEIFIAGFIL